MPGRGPHPPVSGPLSTFDLSRDVPSLKSRGEDLLFLLPIPHFSIKLRVQVHSFLRYPNSRLVHFILHHEQGLAISVASNCQFFITRSS